jgi:hypothetical protein
MGLGLDIHVDNEFFATVVNASSLQLLNQSIVQQLINDGNLRDLHSKTISSRTHAKHCVKIRTNIRNKERP